MEAAEATEAAPELLVVGAGEARPALGQREGLREERGATKAAGVSAGRTGLKLGGSSQAWRSPQLCPQHLPARAPGAHLSPL